MGRRHSNRRPGNSCGTPRHREAGGPDNRPDAKHPRAGQGFRLPGGRPWISHRVCGLAVCGLLLLAVGLAFGQTVGFGFVNLDDDWGVYDNRLVTGELTRGGCPGGIYRAPAGKLGPADVPLAYSRLAPLGARPRGPSPDQPVPARRLGGPAAGGSLADDGPSLAQRVGGGRLCRPSAPRGIGGLGDGAEGRALRAVFHADVGGLSRLRAGREKGTGTFCRNGPSEGRSGKRCLSPFPSATWPCSFASSLGLAAKPMAVTLPFLLLLLDYWPLGRMNGKRGRGEKGRGGDERNHAFAVESSPLSLSRPSPPRSFGDSFGKRSPCWRLLAFSACWPSTVRKRRRWRSTSNIPSPGGSAMRWFPTSPTLGQFFYPVDLAVVYPRVRDCRLGRWPGPSLLLAAITAAAFRLATEASPTCWSAGSGTWGCWCR